MKTIRPGQYYKVDKKVLGVNEGLAIEVQSYNTSNEIWNCWISILSVDEDTGQPKLESHRIKLYEATFNELELLLDLNDLDNRQSVRLESFITRRNNV